MFVDCYCEVCGYEKTIDANEETGYGCPKCGAERGYGKYSRFKWLKCSCEERVDLIGFTNICGCGKSYNSFGDELRPIEDWFNPEDYYPG